MTGRIAIVTGASSGIGYEVAKALAEGGNEVILACKDKDRGQEAIERIKEEFPQSLVQCLQLDLSSTNSVKNFVSEFTKKKRRLNILINNAAVKLNTKDLTRRTTTDGNEFIMATNFLGHFLLTNMLCELMVQTANVMGDGRIINLVCSDHDTENHCLSRGLAYLDPANFQLQDEGTYSSVQAYKNSKLCLLLMTYKLAKDLENTPVTVNAIHPGYVPKTALKRHMPLYKRFLQVCCLHYALCCTSISTTPKVAGLHVYRLATDDKYQGLSSKYYKKGIEERSSIESYDTDLQKQVWRKSCKAVNYQSNLNEEDMDEISLGGVKDPLLSRKS